MSKSLLTDAYAAGLIDGEGCISLARSASKGTPRFSPAVEIGMTAKAKHLLEMMRSNYGGSIRLTRRATDRWDEAWAWGVFGRNVSTVLHAVSPYLLLKSEQAGLVLRFLDLRAGLLKRPNGLAAWTDEAIERAEAMARLCRELNAKGPAPAPSAPSTPLNVLGSGGTPIAHLVAGQWVTHQRSLFDDSGWAPFLETWPAAGTTLSGTAYRRPMSVPRTSVTASSSSHGPHLTEFPTPAATPYGSSHNGIRAGEPSSARPSLATMASTGNWPTPAEDDLTEADGSGMWWPTPKASPSGPDFARAGRAESGGDDLATAVARRWPTPRAADYKGAQTAAENSRRRVESGEANLSEAVMESLRWPTPMARDWRGNRSPDSSRKSPDLSDVVVNEDRNPDGSRPIGGQLNPNFVEYLMGFPKDWTLL